jgi:hypothetical protein
MPADTALGRRHNDNSHNSSSPTRRPTALRHTLTPRMLPSSEPSSVPASLTKGGSAERNGVPAPTEISFFTRCSAAIALRNQRPPQPRPHSIADPRSRHASSISRRREPPRGIGLLGDSLSARLRKPPINGQRSYASLPCLHPLWRQWDRSHRRTDHRVATTRSGRKVVEGPAPWPDGSSAKACWRPSRGTPRQPNLRG